MKKDVVLKSYLKETTPAFIVILILAAIGFASGLYLQAHWTFLALIAGATAIVAGMYAHFVRKIRNGSFGQKPQEREALNKYMARHGGQRVDGMHLPG